MFYVNSIDQLTMADFIRCGQYDEHIRRMRNSYRRRRDTLMEACAPFDVRMSGLSAGLHLLLLLPDDTSTRYCDARAKRASRLRGCRDCGIPTREGTCPVVTAW
jgi:DNA-binding transcriptional MocR family regulator